MKQLDKESFLIEDVNKETWLREHKDDENVYFQWDLIYLNDLSKDFILEFKDYLDPRNIRDYLFKFTRIEQLKLYYGEDFYNKNFKDKNE